MRSVENRVNLGLERQINAIIGYIRFILNTEQKKTDFKPENENMQINTISHVSINLQNFSYTVKSHITGAHR